MEAFKTIVAMIFVIVLLGLAVRAAVECNSGNKQQCEALEAFLDD